MPRTNTHREVHNLKKEGKTNNGNKAHKYVYFSQNLNRDIIIEEKWGKKKIYTNICQM